MEESNETKEKQCLAPNRWTVSTSQPVAALFETDSGPVVTLGSCRGHSGGASCRGWKAAGGLGTRGEVPAGVGGIGQGPPTTDLGKILVMGRAVPGSYPYVDTCLSL